MISTFVDAFTNAHSPPDHENGEVLWDCMPVTDSYRTMIGNGFS